MTADPLLLISKKTGDWWKDDRRNWCAYCGVKLRYQAGYMGADRASKDHLVPKVQRVAGKPKAPHLTIPACRQCNNKKGATHVATFIGSAYFDKVRSGPKAKNAWSLRDLWLVTALAAVGQAFELSDEWPASRPGPQARTG